MPRLTQSLRVLLVCASFSAGCYQTHDVVSRDAGSDVRAIDAGIRDAVVRPDARLRDASPLDTGTPDARDVGTPDVGIPDMGAPDTPVDADEPDVPACFVVPSGEFGGLTCPETGAVGSVQITVTASPGLCCETGTAEMLVSAGAENEWLITGEWNVCDCCAACPCLNPHVVRIVHVVMDTPGIHTVRAGTRSCEILVE